MAQTMLRKRPYRVLRTTAQELYEEPQSRQKLGPEGASQIRFKSTQHLMTLI